MELTYLNNVSDINKEYALSLGFVEFDKNIFVTRSNGQFAVR